MKLSFQNNHQVPIQLHLGPALTAVQDRYKHLQHVPIKFNEWENPFYTHNNTYDELVRQLIKFGKKVMVPVDQELCLSKTQSYLNHLHEIYEKNYNGDPGWLAFHEHIHLCELHGNDDANKKILVIDHRELAGPLNKKFDTTWLCNSTVKVKAGDVYFFWAELGKTPYGYWKNNEPNDINRLCELAKPWLTVRGQLSIALEDVDTIPDQEKWKEFCNWFAPFKEEWMRRWNIDKLLDDEISSSSLGSGHQGAKIIIGKVDNVNLILENLDNDIFPQSIKLL